ncbi:hypothetical protein LTR95_013281 [Oleoguttula sp. CCFEE 5521]
MSDKDLLPYLMLSVSSSQQGMVRAASLLRLPHVRVTISLVVAVLLLILLLLRHYREEVHISILPPRPPQDASHLTQALVIAKTIEEDTDWLFHGGFNESYGLFIYTMSKNDPELGYLRPHTTKGREAAAFLSYVIDYYDVLPRYSIFIHGGDPQRHNDVLYLNSRVLPNLRHAAIDAAGYINLRCDTNPGCPVAVTPHDFTKEDAAKKLDPRAKFAPIYAELFNVPMSEVPRQIGGVCCAQFAVHRDRIRQRPKSDYVRMMHWMATTKETDTFGVGWVMEKLWHVVFGMESVQ